MSEACGGDRLATILAGPVLRRVTANEVVIWLACSRPGRCTAKLQQDGRSLPVSVHCEQLSASPHLHFQLLRLCSARALPEAVLIEYDIALDGQWLLGADTALHYPGRRLPGFVFQPHLRRLLHGSCRKPHLMRRDAAHGDDHGDGLARADALLAGNSDVSQRPSLLLMSGDQIYADDVAGPMLVAIHQLIGRLELSRESLPGTDLSDSSTLHDSAPHYYDRDNILPRSELAGRLRAQFFGGTRKPVFTSANARNHLMSLAEMTAMYLLVWSPNGWQGLDLTAPAGLTAAQRKRYARELQSITQFRAGTGAARRVMAHLPVAMIFDDHDVSDDWNLSAAWEKAAYDHPLSRRVIGNALIAYLLFQGWGNAPEKFPAALLQRIATVLHTPASDAHAALIDELLAFDQWHFQWPTSPPLIVLDTRTHRWRVPDKPKRPSGLLDRAALRELQESLSGHQAVVMVSAAPVFGVKLIEAIQRLFSRAGKALLVDAENWMAHRDTARHLLALFRHRQTPQNFVILSGDVHYSFVYEVRLRGRHSSPAIWQITSSGLRNQFPGGLLDVLDRLNRWLFAPWSPLNRLTKRRDMRISPRRHSAASRGERLLNAAGIGLVELDENGAPLRVVQLCADREDVSFDVSAPAKRP
ncbi:alkaline phosphatase D family protein [Granulosicoccaceae sp. 1_MG-2023]|nr:alkaline phosphatase D family protein [Granulosicoccaceae sp. 1_MG-2023]